ncbi:ATP synthase subunit epsilon, mitochondrial [Callorhinchus milii]|uniref:ATP synthase subunit epsilon, mitochondrial n=1 Tax=Callorhinchus milii TaxID=7868 RepID=K4G620_CALMI|nr:ATP synthase subunit epsilon, mitochondrial [Callorhinchus milii]AFK10919.1 ATP synthase subunit epsilon, mitochondrial [Callorhinchus milii]AFM86413.1 ATP synthase subunit epsilon, mitochondrial [Callorhinchus milii]AFM86645.1 ATP synthase subunit epsilon, mitochondrial [Callorhinchus milii]AFM87634.1 ATP synthase subunit epsilon, mitochondrial [Callorhinchus milii]AFM87635.1 ATP synthase subunit epsilon, mitochondrial [Callorhinchus milii]|eukprot:gi/632939613/ref/XP_007910724.1/ PREDICTED: ATP synthase subunit epsilon, mitochondrial [Callorhinchus milii]
MVAFWRQAGLSYIQYSRICAQAVRSAFKQQHQAAAQKSGETSVKVIKPKKS